jgi:methanethiol S-methyltransferase
MKRYFFFAYGVACHLLFLGTFAYMSAFVGAFYVSKTIDTVVDGPVTAAVAIDLSLLALFAAQHSIMARPAFKRVWTRLVPKEIERSTYVLVSCIVTVVLMWQWRGLGTVIWDVQQSFFRGVLWAAFALGWTLVPFVSLLIDHFDLFGTRQVWLYFRRKEYQPLPFRVPLLYTRVRHPLYIGWTIAFWATPQMTVGHLLFAVALTAYMAIAAHVEERDLVAYFGNKYEDYRRRVPMFVPKLSRSAVVDDSFDSRSASHSDSVEHLARH